MSKKNKPKFYVAIGASAGGLEAIELFFKEMPTNTGMAFIVLQHLSPDYRSMMAELLAKHTKMPILRAEENMPVLPDHVYLIPPKKNMSINAGRLTLVDQDRHRGVLILPIDIFLESLAEDQGELSVAIILSGTGSDGTRGTKAIKAAGGLIMVQSVESSKFDGMPKNAIATGLADYVLAPQEMPDQLLIFMKHPFAPHPGSSASILTSKEGGFNQIMAMLSESANVDFTHYKPNTLHRRVRRRISVSKVGSISEYATFLSENPAELNALYQELLIGVTSFFRDRPVWDALIERIMPSVVTKKIEGGVRIWCVACSTGEEAYGLAIVASEAIQRSGRKLELKVFATDIDSTAIVTASRGTYPATALVDLPPELRLKYFTQQDGIYTVTRALREKVVFARHNVLVDPPFTGIDLVSCRNLLIYFQPVLQQRAMEVFGFALSKGSTLLLGKSEALGPFENDYEVIDAGLKLYSLKVRRVMLNGELSKAIGDRFNGNSPRTRNTPEPEVRDADSVAGRLLTGLASQHIPLTMVTNERQELVHVAGNTQGFIGLNDGRPSLDIVKLAHRDLAIPLATGLQRVMRDSDALSYTNVRIHRDEGVDMVSLHIFPLPKTRRDQPNLYAVLIKLIGKDKEQVVPVSDSFDADQATVQRIEDLEAELLRTRENLQAVVEELETSNEELQATNEELLSSNEELQSTNEELQSVNEELHTVNAENVSKNTELLEMSKDLEDLLVSSNSSMLLLDQNLVLRQFTTPITKVFSIQTGDIGKPISFIRHSLMLSDLLNLMETVSASGKAYNADVQDNQQNNYMMTLLPTPAADGGRRGVSMTLIDINRRIQAERVLRESEERFRLMVNSLPGVAIHMLDPKGYVTTWSDAAQATTGFQRVDVIGRRFDMFFTQEDKEKGIPQSALERAQKNGKAELYGWRLRKDGTKYWASSVISPLKGSETELLGFVRIVQDISEQRERERHLVRLSLTVAQSAQCILIVDTHAAIEYANPAFLSQFQVDESELMGKSLSTVFQPVLGGKALKSLSESVEQGNAWSTEIQHTGADGSKKFFHARLTPVRDNEGAVESFLLVLEDATESVELAQAQIRHAQDLELRVQERTAELQTARENAERLARVKSEFMANISHELRTPLNAVLGLAHVLKSKNLADDGNVIVQRITGAGQLLLSVINDVLDFSKLEAGKLDMELSPFHLDDVLKNLATVMSTVAGGKGIELVISPPVDLRCQLIGDSLRLGQVLLNLTSNAIKFTQAGFVAIKIKSVPTAGSAMRLRFEVQDTGIGMDAAAKAKLFQPFTQADASTTRNFGGTGLGLSISRRFIELLGGQIHVQSALGEGSTFWFELDFDTVETPRETLKHMSNIRTIVLEDNPVALEGMVATAQALGWQAEGVTSGEAFLSKLQADPGLQGVNALVLLDWFLSDRDGGDIALEIERLLPPAKRPMVVVISGQALSAMENQPGLGGVDAVLPKPLTTSELYDTVLRVRGQRLGHECARPADTALEQSLAGRRLLVVDDSETNRDVANLIFSEVGAQIFEAHDGQQALDWLTRNSGAVDVVLMDIQMPVMDGLEATRRIRANPAWSHIPVLALTAGMLQEQRADGHAAGIADFISKPFDVGMAIALIARYCSAAGAPAAGDAVVPGDTGQSVVLDEAAGLAIFKTPKALQADLRKFALQSLPDSEPAIITKALAHKLKGAAGSLGLRQLFKAAADVEQVLHQDQPASTAVEGAVQHLRAAMQAARGAIESYAPAPASAAAPVALDAQALEQLLDKTLAALAQDEPAAAEALLDELSACLSEQEVAPIRTALDKFEFREAEAAVTALAARQKKSAEN
jgi:two-component system, chemotaxis family, CheB/CheR fusion protein